MQNDEDKDLELDIIKQRREVQRSTIIKFIVWCFLGLVVIISGLYALNKYVDSCKPNIKVYCYKETYNGHDYLFLSRGFSNHTGVVHDPDCACHKSVERHQPSAKPKNIEGERYLIMPTVKETSDGTVTSTAK